MKKVLIVDDEVDLCLMIKLFLSKKNYEVHTAHTLSEGYDKINTIDLDSVVLDNNLPDGMGWKLAEKLLQEHPEMHVTLMSAYKAAKDYAGPVNNTSLNILEKPISLNELEKTL